MTDITRSEVARDRLKGYRRNTYAVWEITLKCNLACSHCGSRAGDAREDELNTAKALDLIQQMADCGIGEVSLIGGEAYLRKDWLTLARAITDAGMLCTMTTGGLGISLETAKRMRDAGIARVSVSVDGLEEAHDEQRGVKGSFAAAFRTMRHLKEAGVVFGCNTQINRISAPDLPLLYDLIHEVGAVAWQLQMTVPMGNAADNWGMLLQPFELLAIYPMLARIAARGAAEGTVVASGNNIGYYGPYERLLRGHGVSEGAIWQGCQAGIGVLGIEADGAVKGCPSLPTNAYTGGNINEMKLADILQTRELNINMDGGTEAGTAHMWGRCKDCRFAKLCRGGCSWTAHVFFNRRGNNVYCHYRALELEKQGIRERVVQRLVAIGKPFDNGEFGIIEEPIDAPWPQGDVRRFTADKIRWTEGFAKYPYDLFRVPALLRTADPLPEAA